MFSPAEGEKFENPGSKGAKRIGEIVNLPISGIQDLRTNPVGVGWGGVAPHHTTPQGELELVTEDFCAMHAWRESLQAQDPASSIPLVRFH